VQQNFNNKNTNNQDTSGKTGVMDEAESGAGQPQTGQPQRPTRPTTATNNRYAVDEARQMLDEIAGLGHEQRTARRPARPELAKTVRTILLWPFLVIWAIVKLIFAPLRQADFRLAGEMRKFLKNPGHFFWFNRIAPEKAAQHFGTSSTDAMTHHARRYGAHVAMLILAVVVVFFGGFSGLATKILSAYAETPHEFAATKNSVIVEDSREIYASAVAGNNASLPRRIETITIKDGDTLQKIAAARSLSLETLLYANNLVDPDSALTPGQKLVVPPVTGMLHITNPGDTIGKIADRYGVDPKIIINYPFNNLAGDDASTTLKPLQEVMVPGGSMPLRSDIYMYTVRSGDSLKSVAEKFGLTVDTLLDNNDLDNGLIAGQQIRILPVDGVVYRVNKGETLQAIAAYLGANPQNIINFKSNNVAANVPLQAGMSLIVPGGTWPPPPPPPTPTPLPPQATPVATPAPTPTKAPVAPNAPAGAKKASDQPVAPPAKQANQSASKTQAPAANPNQSKATPKPAAPGQAVQKPVQQSASKPSTNANPNAGVATHNFGWPIRGIITTYFGEPIWYGIHMGLDIATTCGTPTVASDGGTVILSRYDGGYGNSVVIDHGGGFKTRYGHFMSLPPVSVGQKVAKGQVIGYEGTTGASTGCHVHFEVLVNGAYTDPLKWLR
jgi:murein DD-endopeptidase MepM/ murein hydrolase activator NlpD